MVQAPIVGTFYEASSPEAPPFVQVGDKVDAGQVLCIIEAMKLMNEIEAGETRKNSQLLRDIEISLPRELDIGTNIELSGQLWMLRAAARCHRPRHDPLGDQRPLKPGPTGICNNQVTSRR